MRFTGQYNHSLDTKGRVIIPSGFREKLGDRFMVARGLEKCISVYSMEAWEDLENKIIDLSQLNETARKFSRIFFATAGEVETDKQGRILIPAHLRKYAGIDKECVVTGNLDKVEIWSPERWAEQMGEDEDLGVYANQLDGMGIRL